MDALEQRPVTQTDSGEQTHIGHISPQVFLKGLTFLNHGYKSDSPNVWSHVHSLH